MVKVCLYFQVHQPNRLRKYPIFDIGKKHDYFDTEKNKEILLRVSKKCYLPANRLLLDLIKSNKGKFKVSFSITGVLLEQLAKDAPEVIESFKELVETGCVEFLSETYYHTLSFIYSKKEFKKQVDMHTELIKKLFNVTPTVFRNTELIFNNDLAEYVEKMGFKGIITEGADHILGWRSPNYLYTAKNTKIKTILKNYKLSDDIAFRFSNKNWEEYPLSSEKFSSWIKSSSGDFVNLFMDYETIGEHQWADTGIFRFIEFMSKDLIKSKIDFITPSEEIDMFKTKGELDIESFISWADVKRDLTAWIGNDMQKNSLNELYKLEKEILNTKDDKLIEDWRMLQISDHFYYMCTKFYDDGDVHKYFNPYDSPYESYIAFTNILNDIVHRINQLSNNKVKLDGNILENPTEKL